MKLRNIRKKKIDHIIEVELDDIGYKGQAHIRSVEHCLTADIPVKVIETISGGKEKPKYRLSFLPGKNNADKIAAVIGSHYLYRRYTDDKDVEQLNLFVEN